MGYDNRYGAAVYTFSTCFVWFSPLPELASTPSFDLNWASVMFYDVGGAGDTLDVTIAEVDPNNPFTFLRVIHEGPEILPPGDFSTHYFDFDPPVKGLTGDIVVLVDMANSNGSGSVLMDDGTPWFGHNIYYDAPTDGWYYSGYGRLMNIGVSYYDAPEIMSVLDVPNDQGGKVLVSWEASLNEMGPFNIDMYGLWHKVDPDLFDMSNVNPVEVPNMDALYDYGKNAKKDDIVTVRTTEDVATWRFVGMVPPHPGMHHYSLAAGTWKDSTIVDGLYLNTYMVTAYAEDGFVDSEEAMGYSVDNLHPHVPMGFAAMESAGSVKLTWEAPVDEDFNYFALYREDMTEPVAMTTELEFVDADVEIGKEYTYHLTAIDFSGNESDPADATLTMTSVIGSSNMIPTEFALRNNYPNPFNPVTSIKYELPDPSHVTIKVLNIAGQEVATLVNTDKPAGYHTISWDATNVGSGVYFYTMKAGSFKATQKMILTK